MSERKKKSKKCNIVELVITVLEVFLAVSWFGLLLQILVRVLFNRFQFRPLLDTDSANIIYRTITHLRS